MLNYPRALWNPGMQTEEEQAMLITFPLLVSIGRFEKNDKG